MQPPRSCSWNTANERLLAGRKRGRLRSGDQKAADSPEPYSAGRFGTVPPAAPLQLAPKSRLDRSSMALRATISQIGSPRSIKLSRRKVRLNAEMRTACSTLADEVEKVIKSTVEPDQDCGCHTLHPRAGALFLEPATYLAHFPAPGFCCAGGEHELDAGGSALRGRRDCLFGC